MGEQDIAGARIWLGEINRSIAEEYVATFKRSVRLADDAERQRLWDAYAARVRPLQDQHDRLVRLLATRQEDTMKPFKSDALGSPHEYRALFSDRVKVAVAAALAEGAVTLKCRAEGEDDWQELSHGQVAMLAVRDAMDEAEDGGDNKSAPKSAKAKAIAPDDDEQEDEHPHRVTRRGHR